MARFNDRFKEKITRQRISQRDIIPSGVRSRQLGGRIFRTSLSTSSVDVANGGRNINEVRIDSSDDKRFHAIVERATYVDSVSAANLLPGGSGIDDSDFEWYPNIARVKLGGSLNDGNEMVDQLTIVNNSGAQVTLYFYVQVRYILDEGGTGTTTQA